MYISNLSTTIPATGATRPRALTIKDLDALRERYAKGRDAAYDRENNVARDSDEYTEAMHVYFVYSSLIGKLDPIVSDAYARYGRHQLPYLLGEANAVHVATLLATFASVWTYAKLIYTNYPAVLATIEHELALLQSYVGVHIPEVGVATDEELFA